MAGEIQTLTNAGITSINLVSDQNQQVLADGTTIFGQTTFTKTNGTTGIVADVAFKYKTHGYKMVSTSTGYEMRTEQGSTEAGSYFHMATNAINLNLRNNHYDIAVGNTGNDILNASATDYAVLLSGGKGDDTLLGGSGNDILIGGQGFDTFKAGAGDDTLTVNINLDMLNIESVVLGSGISTVVGNRDDINYLITGGSNTTTIFTLDGKDIIYGGSSTDTIISWGGDDYIVAGKGNDIINAGEGADIIYGGTGDDIINAGSGDDTIYLEGYFDTILGGSGADVFKMHQADQHQYSMFFGFSWSVLFGRLTNLIKDFELGVDTLDLTAVKGIRSINDITISHLNLNGISYAKVEVGHGKNAIYLENINASSLTQENFRFYNHQAINLTKVVLSTNEDQSIVISATQLLANAIDVDGDNLSVVNLVIDNNATLVNNNNGT